MMVAGRCGPDGKLAMEKGKGAFNALVRVSSPGGSTLAGPIPCSPPKFLLPRRHCHSSPRG